MSSINPEVSKNINEALNNVGVEFLDAPVSGGEKGAIEGTLSIMVGGKSNVLEKVEHILETMGSSIVLVGPVGAGGYAKLANQIIVGLNIQAMSEAFALSKKAGLDFEKLYKAISKGLAGSQVLDKKIHNLIQEDFTPGFKLELHLKDLNNALNASNSKNLTLPFTQELKEKMVEIVKEGQGESDHSVLYKFQSR
jgi:2-hydroxy-3-oxopropionate reductase